MTSRSAWGGKRLIALMKDISGLEVRPAQD